MNIVGLIPSRMESQRFPGKPLVDINGIPMVVRVYKQAARSPNIANLYVCTDSDEIIEVLKDWDCQYIKTSALPINGTERCAEALSSLSVQPDAVINIQGDEPYIHPRQITQVAELLEAGADICTLAKSIFHKADIENPHVVKVDFNASGLATNFYRNVAFDSNQHFYKHIGIYGYTYHSLLHIVRLSPTIKEKERALEQWRWLENGLNILVGKTNFDAYSVDTTTDLAYLLNKFKQ
ncbi:MAG: 3-deoxy-manno-octulosonate cytidylyltransferase [Chitinophagales bacterium]|nr:3-deoxy-manno-octulosonate cytidylyltransferase [Chitinophagales bacterium]